MTVPGLRTKDDFERMFEPAELDGCGDRWGHRWRASQQLRLEFCLQVLQWHAAQESLPRRVLDVACGQSDFLLKLRRVYPNCECFGSDISANVIQYNQQRYPSIVYRQCALPQVAYPPNSFDTVCALEVLIYLETDQQQIALRNLASVLKPEGLLILSGPLDGGQRYFAEDRILALLGECFDVVRTDYRHTAWYTWLETPALRAMGRLETVSRALVLPNCGLERWLAERPQHTGWQWVLRCPGPVRHVLSWTARCLAWPLRKVLGWRWPARLIFAMDKALRGKAGRTRIIAVARRRLFEVRYQ